MFTFRVRARLAVRTKIRTRSVHWTTPVSCSACTRRSKKPPSGGHAFWDNGFGANQECLSDAVWRHLQLGAERAPTEVSNERPRPEDAKLCFSMKLQVPAALFSSMAEPTPCGGSGGAACPQSCCYALHGTCAHVCAVCCCTPPPSSTLYSTVVNCLGTVGKKNHAPPSAQILVHLKPRSISGFVFWSRSGVRFLFH